MTEYFNNVLDLNVTSGDLVIVYTVANSLLPISMISGGWINDRLGIGLIYGTAISTAVKYFPDKRGLIGGITTAVYGMSSVVLPPIVTFIVSRADATVAFKIFGVVFLAVIILCALILEPCPAAYVPEGYVAAANTLGGKDMEWKAMIKTPVFYVMMLLLMSGAFSGMMITSQTSAVA